MGVKWVAVDIDGTLLDSSGQIPKGNIEAINQVINCGVRVILVTGRRLSGALWVAETLGLSSPLIVHNGAMIRSSGESRRLAKWFLQSKVARSILKVTESFVDCTVLHKDRSFSGQIVVCSQFKANGPLHSYLSRVSESVVLVRSLKDEVDDDLIQIMFSGSIDLMDAVEECLQKSGFLEEVKIAKTYYRKRNLGIIDVLNKDCSKCRALQFLANSNQINPANILAIGDNYSDLEMLEYVGVGVVMANCVEELKGRGFYITTSNDDLGVAKALNQFIL